ncbi:SGNH/GDSL hydrolase family protein [Leptospira sp. WS92.C1]
MNGLYLKIFVFIFSFATIGCDKIEESDSEFYLGLFVKQPSLMLVGDSISAFWPTELLEPFVATKTAFPNRTTAQIIEATQNLEGHYRACTYNGGANDYLSILLPVEDSLIEATVQRQKQAIALMKSKCDSIVVIGIWNVESPWPIFPTKQVNDKMKSEITDVFVFDPTIVITSDMLFDGGHLTYRGYQTMSELIKDIFQVQGILIR